MMPLSLEEFSALPPRTLVVDKHGDRGILRGDGMWHFYETAPLTAEYVFKHYAPLEVVALSVGDQVRTPEEAESLPQGASLMFSGGRSVTRTGDAGVSQEGGTWLSPNGDPVTVLDRDLRENAALVFSLPRTRDSAPRRDGRSRSRKPSRGRGGRR